MNTNLAVLLMAMAPVLSPAESQIGSALLRIQSGHMETSAYNKLASGLTRRARETGDAAYYNRALEALEASLRLDPDNLETLRISAWVRMGRHEFAEAYRITRLIDSQRPDDPANLGVMGDALMELGRYDEATAAYQRMVDLKPGPAAWARVAYLRELTGDLDGAVELLRMSLAATGSRETEDRAWILVQIGHLQDLMGRSDEAETTWRAALDAFPGYHYALTALAQAALKAGRATEAEHLSRQAITAAPHAERYLILADALRAQGHETEARAAEGLFESLSLANTLRNDNENHDLVLYYLERREEPAKALAIARREAGVRRDIHTLDRLALALQSNGRIRKARRLERQVLATGTRDPLIARHVEQIMSD